MEIGETGGEVVAFIVLTMPFELSNTRHRLGMKPMEMSFSATSVISFESTASSDGTVVAGVCKSK